MNPAAWYLRIPIIRHVRYFVAVRRINRHYDMWAAVGSLPVHANKDHETAERIWRGEL